jgi:SAM-dependent methyltransferase
MTMEIEQPLEERIVQIFRHIGITQAHVAASMAPDWRDLATRHPELIASLTLVCPTALDPKDLSMLASRFMVFTGDRGLQPERLRRSLAGFRDATLITLPDYQGETWSDVIADRPREVGGAMREFLQRIDKENGSKSASLPETEGEVAGISYRVRGEGPPLVLFPLALAPSQWEPLLPTLSAHYCVITLGGAALGMVAYLELRGRLGYLGAVRSLMDVVHIRPGETVVEVGCGSGVLIRWLARQTSGANRLLGVDINRYLLREAEALARRDGLGDAITLQEGNGETLPLPDNSVDVAFACTVLEEGNADKMLSEMVRVTRPGGRVAVIVRALDASWWVNLPLRAALKAKVEAPGGVASGVAAEGCADASIYRRFHRAGLTQCTFFPHLVPVTKADPRFALFQQVYLTSLGPQEADEWRSAVAQAEADGTFFMAQPFHCAVGIKS